MNRARITLSEETRQALEQCEIDGNRLTIPMQMDRGGYVALNKIIESLGGKWSRKDKCHLFDDDPTLAIAGVLTDGYIVDIKKSFDQFDTPRDTAEWIVDMVPLKPDDNIIEPSVGVGNLADALMRRLPECIITGLEIDRGRTAAVRDRFADRPNFSICFEGDFLDVHRCWIDWSKDQFDAIVANPPFSRQADIDHVNRMLDIAEQSKRIHVVASVMSAGVTVRSNRKTHELIHRVRTVGDRYSIIDMPPKSFAQSGTNVNTKLVVVEWYR